MKRLIRAAFLSVGLWTLTSGQAFAQLGYYSQPQINPRPVVSPYLNLMNGGNPATTYFGIIRPQMEMGNNIQALQQQVQGVQDQNFSMFGGGSNMNNMMNGIPTNVPTTGHATMFQNYSFYYPLLGRNGGNGGNGGNRMSTTGMMGNGGQGNRQGVFNTNRR